MTIFWKNGRFRRNVDEPQERTSQSTRKHIQTSLDANLLQKIGNVLVHDGASCGPCGHPSLGCDPLLVILDVMVKPDVVLNTRRGRKVRELSSVPCAQLSPNSAFAKQEGT